MAMTDADTPPGTTLGGWMRWAPIIFFELYLNASLAMFAFGPWRWPVRTLAPMYRFVLLAHLALLLGYLSAARREARPYRGSTSPATLLWVSVIATLILFPPTLHALTGGSLDIRGALADPSEAYYRYQELEAGGAGGPIIYLRILAGPLLALATPLLVQSWRTAPLTLRLLGLVAVLSNLLLYVATGRNKGFVDLVLLFPWMIALYIVVHRVRLRIGRIALGVVVAAALLAFVTNYYARNTSGRIGATGSIMLMPLLSGVEADPDNVMIRNQPPLVQVGVLGLTFSQTHGYGALALALEKPWIPTWGFGHSYFLQTVAERLGGDPGARRDSYPGRLDREDGWPIIQYWHSIYPWLASDLSFPGVLVAVFLIGRLLALTWVEAARGGNPYALALFVLLITMLYYFPTNNIVLGFPESMVAFWGLTVLWLSTRGYREAEVDDTAGEPALGAHPAVEAT